MSLIRKLLTTTTVPESVNVRQRSLKLIITALAVDRDGETVRPDGARLAAFQANPIVLYSHNPMLPVGNAIRLDQFADRIEATVKFFGPGETPLEPDLAETLWKLYSTGRMRASSIGFIPITISPEPILVGQRGRTYVEWELLEFSLVAIPSLREAISLSQNQVELACKSAIGCPTRPAFTRRVQSPDPFEVIQRGLSRVQDLLTQIQAERSITNLIREIDDLEITDEDLQEDDE